MKFPLALVVFLAPFFALGWGGRGHHAICSAAVHLVQERELRNFLMARPHTMGHLCNVPDIFWKSLPAEVSKEGNASHYINPEVIGSTMAGMETNLEELTRLHEGQPNKARAGRTIRSLADDMGTLPWRAGQFLARAVRQGSSAKASEPPTGRQGEQDDQLPYNASVYGMMVDMGLLGHFIGDASQPFHGTADFDGYEAGHGGIHGYFEEAIVVFAPPDLESLIHREGRKITKASWMSKESVVRRVMLFVDESRKDIPKVLKADPVTKKSTLKDEKGMQLRTEAVREPAEIGWKKLETLAIRHMARSARMLASLWDEAYVQAGRPPLSPYKSFRYPFTPDYVPLDYVKAKPAPEKK